MPETLEALGALGIRLPAGVGQKFRGIQFIERDLRAAADFPEGLGIGIRRPLLHELLAQKAKESGVRLLWNTPVSGVSAEGVRVAGRVVPARWILGADGAGSRIRKWSGLEANRGRARRYATRRHYRVRPWADRVEIHWGERAQAYVTPISGEEVCIVMIARQAEDAHFEGGAGRHAGIGRTDQPRRARQPRARCDHPDACVAASLRRERGARRRCLRRR